MKSLKEINNFLSPKIKQKLLKAMGDVAIDMLIEGYSDQVYSYEEAAGFSTRTYALEEKENYQLNILSNEQVEVYGTTKPNPSLLDINLINSNTTLAEWIEHGNIPNIFNEKDYEWMHPRPVIETVRRDLNSKDKNLLVRAVASELENNGFRTKIK